MKTTSETTHSIVCIDCGEVLVAELKAHDNAPPKQSSASSTDPNPALVPQVQPNREVTHDQILAITSLHSKLVRARLKRGEPLQEKDVRELLDDAIDLVLEDAEDIVPTALMAVRTTGPMKTKPKTLAKATAEAIEIAAAANTTTAKSASPA